MVRLFGRMGVLNRSGEDHEHVIRASQGGIAGTRQLSSRLRRRHQRDDRARRLDYLRHVECQHSEAPAADSVKTFLRLRFDTLRDKKSSSWLTELHTTSTRLKLAS